MDNREIAIRAKLYRAFGGAAYEPGDENAFTELLEDAKYLANCLRTERGEDVPEEKSKDGTVERRGAGSSLSRL